MNVSNITGSSYDVVKQVPVLRPGMHSGSLSLVALLEQCVSYDKSKFSAEI